jgi:hypothetical protein
VSDSETGLYSEVSGESIESSGQSRKISLGRDPIFPTHSETAVCRFSTFTFRALYLRTCTGTI